MIDIIIHVDQEHSESGPGLRTIKIIKTLLDKMLRQCSVKFGILKRLTTV